MSVIYMRLLLHLVYIYWTITTVMGFFLYVRKMCCR